MNCRTQWFPRHITPVRPGLYECGVRFTSAMPSLVLWMLPWNGRGFLVPFPMVVHQWRGLTKAAHQRALKGEQE